MKLCTQYKATISPRLSWARLVFLPSESCLERFLASPVCLWLGFWKPHYRQKQDFGKVSYRGTIPSGDVSLASDKRQR